MNTLLESISNLLSDRLHDLAGVAEDTDPLRTALLDSVREDIIDHASGLLAEKLITLLTDDELRKIAQRVNEP